MVEKLMRLAEEIHGIVCDCDDKRCTITGEIYDWLQAGEDVTDRTAEDLAEEWMS